MPLLPDVAAFLGKLHLEEHQVEWIERSFDSITSGAACFYDEFTIREGQKLRPICAPKPELKRIQKILMQRFFYRFKSSPSAHGFVRGRSPVTNATFHLNRWKERGCPKDWCLLQVDVENFFPTVPSNEVMRVTAQILKKCFECPEALIPKVVEIIVSLCQREGSLPMGAPTSPVISNLVMSRFDAAMNVYCKKWDLAYSRYADDITVFGKFANRAFPMIAKQLERLGLKVKAKKTRVLRYHRAMLVTGVVINSGETTVSRRFRRRLRAQLHNTRMHVEKAFSPLCKEPRPVPIPVLEGRAGWCASVNPRHRKLVDAVHGIRRVMDS